MRLGSRSKRALLGVAAALLLFAAFGFLAVPPIVRGQVQTLLSAEFERPVRVERVAFNPFTLRLVVEGFTVGDRDPAAAPVLAFQRLEANAGWRSVIERAPVIQSLALTAPSLRLARDADGRLSVQDLIDKWGSRPSDPQQPPPRFALANIVLSGGRVDFDDRFESRTHQVADLEIRVPFVSSLPVHQEVDVEPRIAATVNGAALEIAGRSQPFSADHESSIAFEIASIDLAPYVVYLPRSLPVKVDSLVLDAEVRVDFVQPAGGAPQLSVGGSAALTKLDVRTLQGAPLLRADAVRAQGLALRPLAGDYTVQRIAVEAPAVTLHRRAGEARFLEPVLAAIETAARAAPKPAGAPPAPAAGASAGSGAGSTPTAAPRWTIGEVELTGGEVDLRDERFSPRPLALKVAQLTARVTGAASDLSTSLPFSLDARLDSGERLEATGTLRAQPLLVEGQASLDAVGLKQWWWIAAPYVQADVIDGSLGMRTGFRVAQGQPDPVLVLSGLSAQLESLRVQQRWDRRELLRLGALKIDDVALDLAARALVVGRIASTGGHLTLVRDGSGGINLERAVSTGTSGSASAGTTGATPTPAGWSYRIGKATLDQWGATFSDSAAGTAADLRIRDLGLQAENLGSGRGTRGKVALSAKVGAQGTLAARGPLALDPPSGSLRIDAKRIGVLPAQPWFTPYVNAIVSSGQVTALGDLSFDAADRQSPKAAFKGSVTLADFAASTKADGEELLRWKSLHFGGIDFALAPLKVEIGEIALADFYSRLVLSAQGRLNLQDMVVSRADAAPPQAAPSAANSAAPPQSAQPPAAAAAPAPPVRIGRITLANGNIDFSDFFVRPNYSANLTGMTGTVSTLAPGTPGAVELRGRIDHTGAVSVTGSLDPLSPALFLDLKASARDIDLPRASPYSVKYLGYGIEKGKLSANVAYKVQDRKLEAQNNIVLDQLTFGEAVESPTATKLPVLFAVALLKDRNGVIDVNMPIGGSLDDPDFSVGGIVLRIIFNVIAKAVTAPFALIANLAGGGAELSRIEFAAGSAQLDAEAGKRLQALAKALVDRPGLRLDVAGRADAEGDRDALRRATLERRLKAQRVRERAGAGVEAGTADAAAIDPAEYLRLLQLAYRAADFPKPRNTIGLLKDLPPAEMERLLLANIAIGDDALRELADARANAVKEWLADTGGVPGERIFVIAPKLGSEGLATGATPTAAELALR